MINLYAIPPAITLLILLCLTVFLLSRIKKSLMHLLLTLFCFSLTWWLFGYVLMYLSEDPDHALFWSRIGFIGIVFIPVLTFHFTLAFLNKGRNFWAIFFAYLFSIPALIGNWTPLIYSSVKRHFFGYYPQAGRFYWVFMLAFFVAFIGAIVMLANELVVLTKTKNLKRYQQVKFVFIGFLIGSFGVVDYVVKYGINIYPFGYIAALIFALSIVYAILKYKLLDIEVFIRRTVVFAGLFSFSFFIFSFVTVFLQDFFTYTPNMRSFSMLLSIFIVVASYDPIRRWLVNVTDRFLFQKKYDYQKLLKDASEGMSRIESLDHLLKLVIHFVTMRIRVRNASAVLWDSEKKYYSIVYSRGYERRTIFNSITIPREHPLIQFLYKEAEPLDIERVRECIDSGCGVKKRGERKERFYDFVSIIQLMDEVKAACIVPSFLGKELRSMLILGEKKSGDIFFEQDLNVLYTLAQESAIAIENARLFDEAVNKSRQLESINKQLEDASRRLIVALNQAEDANKRLLDTQAQLIHEQKMATLGRLAASVGHEVNNPLTILSMNISRMILKYRKDPNLRVSEVAEYFEKMESNIQRIKAVVNTLTGLLKKSEKGKFEPLSLKLVIEETLPLVQFQTYLDNLTGTEVEFDIPAQTPLIKGDLERLQEVFLNLFTNAYHALSNQKNRKIYVTAKVDAENSKFVTIDFCDNGCGMDEDTVIKIFNYGYTTKGEGKGSGIGLYMCRYIVELHGGEIKVRSKRGEGTTFTLTLPIHQEEVTRIARREGS